MPYLNYTVSRAFGPIWKWEAFYHGEASAQGYRLTRDAARKSARGWLQDQSARRIGSSATVESQGAAAS